MSFNHGAKHLSGQQQAIIKQNEANDKLLREQSRKLKEEKGKEEIEEQKE